MQRIFKRNPNLTPTTVEHEHQWGTYWHHDACDCGAIRRQHEEDCHKCDEVERLRAAVARVEADDQ